MQSIPQIDILTVHGSLKDAKKAESLTVISIDPAPYNMGVAVELRTPRLVRTVYLNRVSFNTGIYNGAYGLFAAVTEFFDELLVKLSGDSYLVLIEKQFKVSELNVAIMSFLVGYFSRRCTCCALVHPRLKSKIYSIPKGSKNVKSIVSAEYKKLCAERRDTYALRRLEELSLSGKTDDVTDAGCMIEAVLGVR